MCRRYNCLPALLESQESANRSIAILPIKCMRSRKLNVLHPALHTAANRLLALPSALAIRSTAIQCHSNKLFSRRPFFSVANRWLTRMYNVLLSMSSAALASLVLP